MRLIVYIHDVDAMDGMQDAKRSSSVLTTAVFPISYEDGVLRDRKTLFYYFSELPALIAIRLSSGSSDTRLCSIRK